MPFEPLSHSANMTEFYYMTSVKSFTLLKKQRTIAKVKARFLQVKLCCSLHQRLHVENMSSQYTSKVTQALCYSINRRSSDYEKQDTFVMAAVLDPRFKLDWSPSEEGFNMKFPS